MKPHTIDELLTVIYEDNTEHFTSISVDCDCLLCQVMNTIVRYWGSDEEDLAYCDICERDSESVEWCGNCGNCLAHCADSRGCGEWQLEHYGIPL
jgi:hypothetical protein